MSIRARIRDGDAEAFAELFDELARPVYGHAYRLTGNWSTAEDVMALTFLEAWRLRLKIDAEGGSLRPWVLGIATNVARNVRRAARRHDDALARMPAAAPVPDFADEIAARIDAAERLAAVREAYGSLRRGEREVFALCVWSGLDHAEAAEALGVAVGTVRSRLSRARGRLESLAAERQRPSASRQEEGDRDIAVRSPKERHR
ncbi:siderophore-interacting protein [Sphaerisporangium krabiense]|uniref:RNA polymerase sigma-70 factor (ECF subfamily) n=1 Tax=Sphaerisporangium krabiense TaxID=763782 RepID=A0A7W9DPU1_9ACTN|nr:RNA polymerase sigma factor [Sphaerisporangium krabiense]MBB5625720.1 RNA polymerase sigma-70 factor (ECF subfamily) [Sphaerisporangium krabiense]GII62944.1 siderophore-interacting protein [Sphaerisporangium krabiense]